MKLKCDHCGKSIDKPTNEVNRARRGGFRLFCDRRCSGLAKRLHKTKAQKVEEKRLYDQAYRAANLTLLKAKKRAYHARTYDPVKAAVERKKNMPRHVEYCRRPEYRRWKSGYDRKYRATKDFGPFAEAAMLVADLDREIKQRTDKHEIRYQNGQTNKAQRRKRQGQQVERGRNAPGRRSGYPAPNG